MPDWDTYYSVTTNSTGTVYNYQLSDETIQHIYNAKPRDCISIKIDYRTPEERAADAAERRLFPLFFLKEKQDERV